VTVSWRKNSKNADQTGCPESHNGLADGAPAKQAQGIRRSVEARQQYMSVRQRQRDHDQDDDDFCEE
jgi:hypothetical protein